MLTKSLNLVAWYDIIQENAFDWLDAPIMRLGAINSVPPSTQNLEKLFLPDSDKLIKKIKEIL